MKSTLRLVAFAFIWSLASPAAEAGLFRHRRANAVCGQPRHCGHRGGNRCATTVVPTMYSGSFTCTCYGKTAPGYCSPGYWNGCDCSQGYPRPFCYR